MKNSNTNFADYIDPAGATSDELWIAPVLLSELCEEVVPSFAVGRESIVWVDIGKV